MRDIFNYYLKRLEGNKKKIILSYRILEMIRVETQSDHPSRLLVFSGQFDTSRSDFYKILASLLAT